MDFIRNFQELNKNDAFIAGGKGASLGEMTQAGIPVPPGFVILSSTFDQFIKDTDLIQEIDALLDKVNHKEISTIESASEQIQGLIKRATMPQTIVDEIKKQFKDLDAEYVAVRSSATAEDGQEHAWAGQLDSYLNTTEATLLENVQHCWASLFTPRAIFYRFEKGLHTTQISVAVVVQKMVNSEISGIAFSVHPVTEDRNQLIIEAGFGLGEAIVSGQITPDSYVVEKEPRRIIDVNTNTQTRGLYRAENGGNEWQEISEPQASSQVLSEAQIAELSKIIVGIEDHYGFPCDIEWAYEDGKFYVVQSRPITTLKNAPQPEKQELFLERQHIRDYTAIKISTWSYANISGLEKEIGAAVGLKNTLFLSNGESVKIYYDAKELAKVFSQIGELARKKEKVENWVNRYLHDFKSLEPYIKQEKEIKSIVELEKFYNKYKKFWTLLAIIFVIPSIDSLDEDSKKLAYDARTKTQEFTEADNVFKIGLRNCFPKIPEPLLKFLLPEEIFGEREISIEELQQRKKGYIYFENQIFTGGSITNFIKEKNIRFDDDLFVLNDEKIKGQTGFSGLVRGRVKICITAKQIAKVKKQDILVAPMTTPDFIPAMRIASAFVTDEGGITCHASIVAREMNKPCIIGTKIATQVLKDGDLVEVDADNGVVSIVERAPEDGKHGEGELGMSFDFDKDRIMEYLKSHRMDIQNAKGSFFTVDLVFSSYVESEKIHGLKFTPIFVYLEGGNNFFQIIPDENVMNVARKVYKDYLADEKTLDVKIDAHAEITKKIDELWKSYKKKENRTDQELLDFFRKMMQMSKDWWLYGVIGEDKGRIIDEEIIPLFEKNHKIDRNKAFEIISILSHSEEQAAFSMERKSFYDACSYVLSDDDLKRAILNDDISAIKNNPKCIKNFEDYRKNYFYKNTDFSDRKEVTIETIAAEIKEEIQKNTLEGIKREIANIENAIQEIKNNKQRILSSIAFTPEEKRLINFAYKTVRWIDERKVGMMKQFYYLFSFLHEIAERYHVRYEDVAVLFVPEVERLLGAKKGLRAEDLEKRRKSLMIVYETGEQVKIFYGQDANNMFQLSKGILDNPDGLKGSVASKGSNKMVSGVVRIIEDPANDVFYEDEILVTSMTRIEFVPLMKKAKMIITDEGGIACHAAIVSRELGVPCIIGTKNATDILANGDVIEADIEKGVITVIKKYGN